MPNSVLLEMLMTRDGVIGRQSSCNDEIEFVIDDMCT